MPKRATPTTATRTAYSIKDIPFNGLYFILLAFMEYVHRCVAVSLVKKIDPGCRGARIHVTGSFVSIMPVDYSGPKPDKHFGGQDNKQNQHHKGDHEFQADLSF